MPRVTVQIRWADGAEQAAVSPSRAIERFVVARGRYPRDELVRRLRDGLAAASERVRERYGVACTAAAEELAAVQAGARVHGGGSHELCAVESVARELAPPTFPAPDELSGHHEAIVVGGGQAGLAASRCLSKAGVEHLVLERRRVACTWREQRWDSFCLVTPNWQCQLPEYPYAGGDPDGFMVNEEIVSYLEGFAAASDPPLYEGVAVLRVCLHPDGGFRVQTSHGELTAGRVILAVGGYHVPKLPRIAERLQDAVTQLHSSGYRNPGSLPDGAVLVVGSGQSGAQIAEDLLLAGRDVHLCVGSAPRVARFYRGRDCVAWLHDMGHYDMPVEHHSQGLAARREPNHYVTGRDGGRDIDLRAHARDGMHLHGRLLDVHGTVVALAGDLRANLDAADGTAERIKRAIDEWIERGGIDAPTEPPYAPVWTPPSDGGGTLDLEQAGIGTVIWSTGFRSDWSWIDVPAFDGGGYPANVRGVTSVPGLYVLGLPWLHSWGSGRFAGIARDAEYVARHIESVHNIRHGDGARGAGGADHRRYARAGARDG
ncbi:MAG TPA: MSMEG_0569 family flavin-dependent oxidoreductase [Solirubrobacteraceae bacterium]|nr:MSMEG_0569 family flavin-dependent oxidoreductase [Solirubrobacteraceae bacterium]